MTRILAVAVVSGLLFAGCSSPTTPAASISTSKTSLPPVPPQVTNPSTAAIQIADSFAIVRPTGTTYAYEVRFLLRETGNRSGATVNRIAVYGPNGIDLADSGCWQDQLYVPRLGQLDTFYTDAGADWLLYCGPGSAGGTATPSLTVIVTFTDDAGMVGSISFPITTLK